MSSTLKPVKKLKYHVFVCMNERPAGHPRGCCKERGAEALLESFKKEISDAGIASEIRAQRAGCLDTCEFGPAVVVYPDDVWYGPLTSQDVGAIVREHLAGGKPVERLRIPGK